MDAWRTEGAKEGWGGSAHVFEALRPHRRGLADVGNLVRHAAGAADIPGAVFREGCPCVIQIPVGQVGPSARIGTGIPERAFHDLQFQIGSDLQDAFDPDLFVVSAAQKHYRLLARHHCQEVERFLRTGTRVFIACR